MEILDMALNYLSHILINIGRGVEILVRFLPLVIAIFLVIVFLTYLDEIKFKRISGSRIAEIDSMSPDKFRLFIKTLLTLLGYKMDYSTMAEEGENEEKPPRPKTPVDAVILKGEERFAVFIVRKTAGAGIPFLNRLQQAVKDHHCQAGIIINSGYFPPEEKRESSSRNIYLWDRDRLIRELLRVQGIEDPKSKDVFGFIGEFWKWLVRGG